MNDEVKPKKHWTELAREAKNRVNDYRYRFLEEHKNADQITLEKSGIPLKATYFSCEMPGYGKIENVGFYGAIEPMRDRLAEEHQAEAFKLSPEGFVVSKYCNEDKLESSFIAGFDAAWDFAEQTMVSRESVDKLVEAHMKIIEEHPDCTCETYDSEAAVICATCISKQALAEYHAAMKDEK